MTTAAVPLDTAALRPASAPRGAVIRSQTEEPYNETSDMSFGDFLDMVNPLQHIPIVGTIYRAVTGDTIKPAAQVIGDIAYGGVIGGITSIFSAIIGQANGRSIEDTMLASLGLGGEQPTTVTEAKPATATPATTTQVASLPAAPAAPAPVASPVTAPAAAPVTASTAAPKPQPAAPQSATAPAQSTRLADATAFGDHRPSKMPTRDTMLASSVVPKQAASLAQRATPMPPKGPAVAPSVGAIASQGANAGAPQGAAANANAPVPQEMISDVMMRNLAKYEAAKKALNPTTPNIRVAG